MSVANESDMKNQRGESRATNLPGSLLYHSFREKNNWGGVGKICIFKNLHSCTRGRWGGRSHTYGMYMRGMHGNYMVGFREVT